MFEQRVWSGSAGDPLEELAEFNSDKAEEVHV